MTPGRGYFIAETVLAGFDGAGGEKSLTAPAMRVLLYLAMCAVEERAAVHREMVRVARAVGVKTATLTGTADALAKRGLVVRESDAQDRRVVRLALTDAGTAMMQGLVKSLERRLES